MTALLVGSLLAMGGCAHVISPQLMDQVDRSLDYRVIAADPAAARGKMVLLGGTIVQTVPKPGLTEVEVVQRELDRWDAPRLTDRSEGRFIIISERFLDPAVFSAGRDITVAGEVMDPQTRRLGEIDYRYPVIREREMRLWRAGPPGYPYPYGGPYDWWWRSSPNYPGYPYYPYWF
ncbi:MAG TPA: Slp/YeaY family lipoprotein [Steroidobacteraceae bacterium]|nr:Slp/YeaY family lipoprotein [Steroidobacteraceae bacterium]